jgi:hypothetical protein
MNSTLRLAAAPLNDSIIKAITDSAILFIEGSYFFRARLAVFRFRAVLRVFFFDLFFAFFLARSGRSRPPVSLFHSS